VKKKHFIFIIQNKNKNRKHIKINNKEDKSFLKELKHEPNIVEITHLCIRHVCVFDGTYYKMMLNDIGVAIT
jgi:hypothetical protein